MMLRGRGPAGRDCCLYDCIRSCVTEVALRAVITEYIVRTVINEAFEAGVAPEEIVKAIETLVFKVAKEGIL